MQRQPWQQECTCNNKRQPSPHNNWEDASRGSPGRRFRFQNKNPQPPQPRTASAEGLQACRISSRNALSQNGYGWPEGNIYEVIGDAENVCPLGRATSGPWPACGITALLEAAGSTRV